MANHLHALPSVASGVVGEVAPAVVGIPSEIPDAPIKLTAKEKRIWEHVTASLHEVGLIHRTDALLLSVICRTFIRWAEAEEQLTKFAAANGGSYITTTPNGYQQPHQIYYVSRNIKRELLQWLPEAALTIPSFHKIVGDRANPEQGTLFDDPIDQHRKRKAVIGLQLHEGGE